ncbi:hypothetical protein SUGI_0715490 [Cryptomeria japonica]|nr:hypothetical protein SUGI_0715490 [Cryptomeria japonica]
MEDMPGPRTMSDMLILPNGEIIIINGARQGVAGWSMATDPVLTRYLYRPAAPVGKRFFILAATGIPRMYYSTANMMADGRIIVGGSNPHAAPPSGVAAPPGYYMLFIVNGGIPSVAQWVHFS